MPDIAKFLKEEIRRLARKEIKAQTQTTRKAAIQHRREIAQLKRLILQQEKKIASLQSSPQKAVSPVTPAPDAKLPEGYRYSPRSVRSQRKRLKLSAQEFAKLLGVSMQTVYSWEQGRARPRRSQIAALLAARGIGRREAYRRLGIVG